MARPGLSLPLLGWREWIALPDLDIAQIKAKVDTGAATSALHALDIEPFERDAAPWVAFTVQPAQRSTEPAMRLEAPLVPSKRVRSSTGQQHERPTIRTTFEVAGIRAAMNLTLIDRSKLGFRLLLGRRALQRRFLVDPGRSFQAGNWVGARERLTPDTTA